jgi:hypothetical protein
LIPDVPLVIAVGQQVEHVLRSDLATVERQREQVACSSHPG